MATVSVQLPPIGIESLFTFKKPFSTYVNTILNLDLVETKLKVLSIVSMPELIALDNVDPYTKYYIPLGIPEADFKNDLQNDVPIITFMYNNTNGIRVPLSYVSFYRASSQIEYMNKLLVMDLGELPMTVTLEPYFTDIQHFILSRIGISPSLKEINIGKTTPVDEATDTANAAARALLTTVYDTNDVALQKLNVSYNDLLARFNAYKVLHP